MKRAGKTFGIVTVAVLVSAAVNSFAQAPGEWTWMHGDNTPNTAGVYGVIGVASPANKPPALYEVCDWKDNNGNFWIFGGVAGGNYHSVLWKFDPVTNQWTWMKGPTGINSPGTYGVQGVSSPANFPGARSNGAATWVDAAGDLWLFGGQGYASTTTAGYMNDLWKYNIATNEWTWMKGSNMTNDPGSYGTLQVSAPANLPPAREESSCTWTSNTGDLWIYGGCDVSGRFSDMWKYTIATNEWTWMHGTNTPNALAVYGTLGTPAPANTPGGRWVYGSWKDLTGNFWLHGGNIGSVTFILAVNDLWKYDVATNQWTWMSGTGTMNDPGNYGTKCVTAATNMPPARMENRARVIDTCGNFWNFGGGNGSGYFNDLWHYNVSTGQWTWASGDNTMGQTPVYGSLGVSAPTNKPGAKRGSVAWMDNNGYIWLFGGLDGTNVTNDLFRFVPDTACVGGCAIQPAFTASVSASNTLCSGSCTGTATVTPVGGTTPYTYSWSDGQTGATATGLCAGTYSVTVTDAGSNTVVLTVTVSATGGPVAAASASATTITAGGSSQLNATGGVTYQWSPASGLSCTACPGPVATPAQTTTYCVLVTDSNGCTDSTCITILVDTTTSSVPCNYDILRTLMPNAFSPNADGNNDLLCVPAYACVTEFVLKIYDRWGEKIFESASTSNCWDGRYKDKNLNTAVFVYYFEATLSTGDKFEQKGNISLIR
ncbi:MAG: Kelch repeat type 2-containing protein [Bacteroidetes bacterium]|nr:MAG: Kelch repeat type 2-containing protein [Bacteroidota bacterium]